jgi:hypothetical protein
LAQRPPPHGPGLGEAEPSVKMAKMLSGGSLASRVSLGSRVGFLGGLKGPGPIRGPVPSGIASRQDRVILLMADSASGGESRVEKKVER